MLRAKAIKFKKGDTKFRDNIITSTDIVGKMASLPLVNTLVNSGNKNSAVRAALDSGLGIHKHAKLPEYHRKTARKQHAVKIYNPQDNLGSESKAASAKTDRLSRAALFTTCYCNYNEPDIADSVIKILNHNGVAVSLPAKEHCCGMPKLELGDLTTVRKLKKLNVPPLNNSCTRATESLLRFLPVF